MTTFSPDTLIDEHYTRLHGYASRMLKRYPVVKRWEDTDDVFHLSLMRLVQALQSTTIESELHFRRLASLQIRRMLIDMARSLRGPHGIAKNHDTHFGRESRFDEGKPLTKIHDDVDFSEWEAFHLAVEKLPAEHRDVFDLCWYSELPNAQVARLLSIDVRTVQRRYRNARLEIARTLKSVTDPSGTT